MELKGCFNSEKEATIIIVVCANESEHNPQQASLYKTLTGDHAKKLAVFWFPVGSTRGSTLVRVRVRTYAARELRFSGMH